jgi:DMSO/TMAO reductase YedYZ molybdopterin-dependent catalytic subunit
MGKMMLALASIASLIVVSVVWSHSGSDRSMMANAAAQAPTPTVSVTTLPAMPGTPTPAPIPTVPLTPLPATNPMNGPTLPPVGVAYIPVVGQVLHPLNITLSQMQHMKPISLTLHFHTYTGVPLLDILKQAQPTFPSDPATLMRKYVYVQGFDGESAILSFPEFTQDFNGQIVMLAYLVDLKDVKPPGFAQLVVQGDKMPTRFIKVARLVVGEPPR